MKTKPARIPILYHGFDEAPLLLGIVDPQYRTVTAPCCYCGSNHTHGIPPGKPLSGRMRRTPHCVDRYGNRAPYKYYYVEYRIAEAWPENIRRILLSLINRLRMREAKPDYAQYNRRHTA